MDTTKKLSDKLNDYTARKDDLKIKGWSLGFDEGLTVKLGLDNGEIGGPYDPPATREVYIGSVYIQWEDGKVSTAKIDAPALENLDAAIKDWKSASYFDADAPDILEPQIIPTGLKIKDEKIVDLITKDGSYLFEILNFFRGELKKKSYVKTIQADITAEHLYSKIMNSKGFDIGWEETDMLTYASVNRLFGDAYHKRRIPEKKDLKVIIKEIDNYMTHFENVVEVKPGKISLILLPEVLDQFIGKLLISENLSGSAVANNQSFYSIEDFKAKKQVFDKRINFIINGFKDYSPATQPCTSEGVPAGKQYVIADGRLMTPLLNLKHAKKTGMSPKPAGELILEVSETMNYNKMVKEIKYGLIAYDVLGMHTQNSKKGDYSIPILESLLVENGEIKGAVKKGTIAGNIFDSLKDEKTKYAKYKEDHIAMKTETTLK